MRVDREPNHRGLSRGDFDIQRFFRMPAARAFALLAGALLVVAFAKPVAAADEDWRTLVIDGKAVHWPYAGTGIAPLRYALAGGIRTDNGATNCASIGPFVRLGAKSGLATDQIRAAAALAFARWAQVSSLRFVEVADEASADIVIGEQTEPTGYAFTNVDLGRVLPDGARAITHSQICLNPERPWKIGFDGNLTTFDLVHTLTHEIGHAIGLDHPGARGHVMSFRYDEAHVALTAGDISGVVALYGARRQADPAPLRQHARLSAPAQ